MNLDGLCLHARTLLDTVFKHLVFKTSIEVKIYLVASSTCMRKMVSANVTRTASLWTTWGFRFVESLKPNVPSRLTIELWTDCQHSTTRQT
jgi:hypothetical protein